MVKIKVRNNESLEQALRRFNRDVLKEGILKELKERERYTKPSEWKRQKNKEKQRKIYFERMRG
ncbi:TPA: 30S ribosomal protein S21 [candidate division WWE3 bacterium]|uniref:Small ribosomal subunit protein bS21 n=5 Tax=Katanobacteria TaxID=422282 RepID=A0A0G1KMW0_UNCKA|nr:MAG: 30S ribosomal protein S21 [candidate division WWE3 bacterium GW2011_GWA2_44_16]KKT68570.1 MAG: 30S ribosomal protein S21 [candidate division WWE3 bacterium GW2011_GWB1_44_4]KKT84830.1 MAG: 30S ribosomal protein S21 [candidate division WWE3 bacterium GW2011_GWC2_44_9]OGC52829.1 MAG: 30S ribosomal protein S21 [candidate division WWE3 bacterium RIFCSPHIGHO2_01_FULL_43_9]HAZ29368.1 30S ribosomal protein S21 [candidate division WWE3 bacterium]